MNTPTLETDKITKTKTVLPTLLVVDDDDKMRRSLLRALADEPYRVLDASSGQQALEILSREMVHVVLSDHDMPGMTGLDLLRMVRLRHAGIVRLMITASNEFEVAVRAINLGEVSRFLQKPWDDDELCFSVKQAFEQAAQERELKLLRAHAKGLTGALRKLEARYPGISAMRRDRTGAILLEEQIDESGALTAEAVWSTHTSTTKG